MELAIEITSQSCKDLILLAHFVIVSCVETLFNSKISWNIELYPWHACDGVMRLIALKCCSHNQSAYPLQIFMIIILNIAFY